MSNTKAFLALFLLLLGLAGVTGLSQTNCQDQNFVISCSDINEVIVLTDVFYGRRATDICTRWGDVYDSDCVADESYGALTELCFGVNSCAVTSDQMETVFGNPCQGVRKYLQVEYECVQDSEFHDICDGDIDASSDPHGFVHSRFYPGEYINNDFCRVQIIAERGQEVNISVYDVDMEFVVLDDVEYCYDRLVFMLPDYSDRTFCSKSQSSHISWRWSNHFLKDILTISFESSEYLSKRGFLFEYQVTGCADDDRPPPPTNGYVIFSEASRIVMYNCFDGYALDPPAYSQSVCLGNSWTGTIGACVHVVSTTTTTPEPTTTETTTTTTSSTTSPTTTTSTTTPTTTSTTSSTTTSTTTPTTTSTTTTSTPSPTTTTSTTTTTTTTPKTTSPTTTATTTSTTTPSTTTTSTTTPSTTTTSTTTPPTTTTTTPVPDDKTSTTSTTTSTTTTTTRTTSATKEESSTYKFVTDTTPLLEKSSPGKSDVIESSTKPSGPTTPEVGAAVSEELIQPIIITVVALVLVILIIIVISVAATKLIKRRRKLEDMDSADSLRPSSHACVSIPNTYGGVGFAKTEAGLMQTSGRGSMTGSNITDASGMSYDSTFYDSSMGDDGSMMTSARPRHYTNTDSDEYLVPNDLGSEVYNSGSGLIENEVYDNRQRQRLSAGLHTIQEEPSTPAESGALPEEDLLNTSVPNSELSSVMMEPTGPPPMHTRPVSLNDNKDGKSGLPVPKVDYPLFKDDDTGNLSNYLDCRRVSV